MVNPLSFQERPCIYGVVVVVPESVLAPVVLELVTVVESVLEVEVVVSEPGLEVVDGSVLAAEVVVSCDVVVVEVASVVVSVVVAGVVSVVLLPEVVPVV